MSRPVSYNLIQKPLEKDISVAPLPDGHQGEGFFATSLDSVIGLARKNSIWPLPLPLLVVVLSLWLRWVLIMIWLDSDLSG